MDMGCGPGYSTHFLADLLACDHTVGLDNSANYISAARETQGDRVSFYLHDVTSVPFPAGPGDLLFCRFLLTHLREPQSIVDRWTAQLRPKGLLLMEEVESIHTANTVFSAYLTILEAMLQHQGNTLYVGPVLDRLQDTANLKRRMSRVQPLEVPTHRAASMFTLNIQTWKHHPFIAENYSPATIDKLKRDLTALTEDFGSHVEIEWGMRQLAFERI